MRRGTTPFFNTLYDGICSNTYSFSTKTDCHESQDLNSELLEQLAQ